MWCYADWRGNFEERPARLKAEILPYEDCDMVAMIAALIELGFLRRYEVKGRRYLNIPNFLDHQNPHKQERMRPSKIPDFPDAERDDNEPPPTCTGMRTENTGVSSVSVPNEIRSHPADSRLRIPDSGLLIPDTGLLIDTKVDTSPQDGEPLLPTKGPPRSAAVVPLRSSERFAMAPGWSPGRRFADRLIFAGCAAPPEFWQDCLPEFILFREARQEIKTQAQWEHKFVQDVMHKYARWQTAQYANDPHPIASDWQPSTEAWAAVERRGIERGFAQERRDDFALFWRDAGAAKRSWNALFVDFVSRRWSERQPERMSTWESYTDTSWADGVALAAPILDGTR